MLKPLPPDPASTLAGR